MKMTLINALSFTLILLQNMGACDNNNNFLNLDLGYGSSLHTFAMNEQQLTRYNISSKYKNRLLEDFGTAELNDKWRALISLFFVDGGSKVNDKDSFNMRVIDYGRTNETLFPITYKTLKLLSIREEMIEKYNQTKNPQHLMSKEFVDAVVTLTELTPQLLEITSFKNLKEMKSFIIQQLK